MSAPAARGPSTSSHRTNVVSGQNWVWKETRCSSCPSSGSFQTFLVWTPLWCLICCLCGRCVATGASCWLTLREPVWTLVSVGAHHRPTFSLVLEADSGGGGIRALQTTGSPHEFLMQCGSLMLNQTVKEQQKDNSVLTVLVEEAGES